MTELPPIVSGVYHLSELPVKRSADREGRRFFEGSCAHFEYLEVHTTTQQKGAEPKPPHAQEQLEELFIATRGRMKFTIDGSSKELREGSAIIIPPHAMQAVENIGDGPLTYYVLEFRSRKPMNMQRSANAGGTRFFDRDSLSFNPSSNGGSIPYFDTSSAMCERFEMHQTQLNQPGPGHDPHSHPETELVLVLEGELNATISNHSYSASAGDIIFINSNEPHGLANPGPNCRYLIIRWK